MKILQLNRKFLELLGLLPINKLKRWAIGVLFVSTLGPSSAYSIQNADDLIISSQALYLLLIACSCNNDLLCWLFKGSQLNELFSRIEQLINWRKSQRIKWFSLYEKVERNTKILTITFQLYLWIGAMGTFAIPLIVVLVHYLNGTYSSDLRWEFPFKIALPVADDQTWRNYIFGYSYCIAFCTMGTVVWCLTDSLFFSLCLYKKGLFKDIELAIHDCVDGEETRFEAEANFSSGNPEKATKEKLVEIIKFHQKTIKLLHKFSSIYDPIIFVRLITNAGAFTFGAYLVDRILEEKRGIELLYPCSVLCVATFVSLLVYCHFGDVVTYAALSVSDACYNSAWHALTPELRRTVVLIMIRSQQTFHITGFNVMYATTENFATVMNTTMSMITFLRSFK